MKKINRSFCRFLYFCFRSIFRTYGHYFFLHSFLNHPIKTLKEFFLFPTYISKKDDFLPVCFFSEDKKAFLKQFSKHKSKSLVAIGYCSKPYNSQDKRLCCPSGRFNHRCMFLENINLKANSFSYPSTVPVYFSKKARVKQ